MGLKECAILNKPVVVVAKEGSKIYGLVRGYPITKEIILYR
jgi:small nuclear ribonucleoprotein (snRNP)-like protein